MTIDCPGAFLQAQANCLVIMKLCGPLVEVLLMIEPVGTKCVTTDKKGENMLYAQMSKAFHELLKSAFGFYNKLRSTLKVMVLRSIHVIHA